MMQKVYTIDININYNKFPIFIIFIWFLIFLKSRIIKKIKKCIVVTCPKKIIIIEIFLLWMAARY